ncbi:MAG: thiamine pyrophosphate-binding protein [Burkholderiales bacterium]|nr:thiamine pyrophosphate-binding protein [Burkholderiales bacterium]
MLVRCLRAEGVDHVFGLVGGKLAPLLKALAQERAITFTGVRHESSAAMMAAAAFAGRGRIAVAIGEMGPGALNLAAGLGGAFANNLPLLAITTNQHRAAAYPHAGMFMDLDSVALTRPVTKWNAVVHDARRLPDLVRRAFREALSGRPGPVHLDVPQDVLSSPCMLADGEDAIAPERYRALDRPRPCADAVARAVACIGQARRPLIVAGGGVVAADAAGQVRALAARLGAPVLPTQMALGVVASDSAHFIGHGGLIAGSPVWQAIAAADVIVAIGCRHSSWMWDDKGPMVRRTHRVVSINIDPAALGHPVLHEVAMQADARAALDDLLAALGPAPALAVETGWLDGARAARRDYRARLDAMADEAGEVMHPAALARAVAQALPRDALAVYDGGHTTFWSNDFTGVAALRTRFHEPGMSHLGFGLPHALALKRVLPDRPVFNLTGDGSFGFTVGELDTARRYRLGVVTIIHNNASWGVIRAGQKHQGFDFATSLEDTDYAAIARGFGCHGETVTRADEVAGAVGRSLASGLPAVLDCRTRFVPHPCMPGFGAMNRYGFEALTGAAG